MLYLSFPCSGKINLVGKPSWQSGTFEDATSPLAIDGSLDSDYDNMHCSHTAMVTNAWWGVDMVEVRQVASLQIANRATFGE